MRDMADFARDSERALEALKIALLKAEEGAEFEVEESGGALQISFEDPPARFVISPNSAVHQIWISAHATSFKLDWSEEKNDFVLPKTGEALKPLVARLVNEQLGAEDVRLD